MNHQSKSDWTSKFLVVLGTVALLAVPALTGCIPGDGTGNGGDDPFNPGNNPTDDDDVNPVEGTSFHGVVRGAFGDPIEGVTVRLSNGLETLTDHQGRFILENIEDVASEDPRVQVAFVKSGYAKSHTPFDLIPGLQNFLMQTMAEVDLVLTFDSTETQDLVIEHEGSNVEIQLPGDNFVDEHGDPYDGDVTVEATFYDLTSNIDQGLEIFAAPGDFTTAAGEDGEEQILESFGMLQVNLIGADGQELNLGETGSALLIPVQSRGSTPVAGEEVAAWSYDEEVGKWYQEGFGTVVDIEGELFWQFEATHFSTWNCDRPLPTHGCLTGQVTDSAEVPRQGATVRAVGQSYISTTTARTDGNGNFCLEVKNGETVWVEISYSIGGQPATQRTDPVTIPSGQATCTDGDSSDCVDLGVIPVDIMSCVTGVIIDGQNQPVQGADIVSPQGGLAQSDANGSFCLAVPVFQSTQVYVRTDTDDVGYQPVGVYSQPGTPDCQGGCANVVVLRPYTNTSCAHGAVVINNQQAPNIPVQVFDGSFPDVAVYSTLTELDGSYCVQLPTVGEVTVQVGDGENLCGAETVSASSLGGEVCDESAQSECISISDFVCTL